MGVSMFGESTRRLYLYIVNLYLYQSQLSAHYIIQSLGTYCMCVCSNRYVWVSFHYFQKLIFAGCVPNLKNAITTLTNW